PQEARDAIEVGHERPAPLPRGEARAVHARVGVAEERIGLVGEKIRRHDRIGVGVDRLVADGTDRCAGFYSPHPAMSCRSAPSLEALHGAPGSLGGAPTLECAEVLAPAGSRVPLSRVEAIVARFELSDHRYLLTLPAWQSRGVPKPRPRHRERVP